jgi:FkbH-like protein
MLEDNVFQELCRKLRAADVRRFSLRDFAEWERRLQEIAAPPSLRMALLGNVTLDLLPRYIRVWCAREGLFLDSYTAGYGQHFQAILSEDSTILRYKPDIVFLALEARELGGERLAQYGALSGAERRVLVTEMLETVERWITLALERLSATLLIANFSPPARPQLGIADTREEFGELGFYRELNSTLASLVEPEPRVQVVDLEAVAARFGRERLHDPKLYYLARLPWTESFLPILAEEIIRHVKAALGLTRKCLVVDLDGTLWGGVVGEEGVDGIQIGPGDPVGEAFRDFQYGLKALQARGILLAVCSKNNPADVAEVFQRRPEMVLTQDDFAATRINWRPKPENIAEIATELSIGLESLVFADDNPVECGLVEAMLPQVEVLQLPSDVAEFRQALEHLTCFEKTRVLPEDAAKTEQYRTAHRRRELLDATGNLEAYLLSLETWLQCSEAKPTDLMRAHQLFSKTNQFNVTTKRYSMTELESLLHSGGDTLCVARAGDRFGELGMIAAYLLRRHNSELQIDSFLMSCRAMGRGIEIALMNELKRWFLEESDAERLVASFLPTAKNIPARDFFDEQGFELVERLESGERRYSLARSQAQAKDCEWIRIQR